MLVAFLGSSSGKPMKILSGDLLMSENSGVVFLYQSCPDPEKCLALASLSQVSTSTIHHPWEACEAEISIVLLVQANRQRHPPTAAQYSAIYRFTYKSRNR